MSENPESHAVPTVSPTSTEILGNHFATLLQWCVAEIARPEADLAGVTLVLDCLEAMVTSGGDRLGSPYPLYVEALREARHALDRATRR